MKITLNSPSNKNQSFGMHIEKISGVSNEFVEKIAERYNKLPTKWDEILSQKSYNIFCLPKLSDLTKQFPELSPKEIPDIAAITITHPMFRLFAFTPKIPKEYLDGVVNHEIAHGIVFEEDLAERYDVKKAFYLDKKIYETSKNKLKRIERKTFEILFKGSDQYSKQEILADTLAWLQDGGGLYGTGWLTRVKRPEFIPQFSFNLSKLLERYKIGEKNLDLPPSDEFRKSLDNIPF